MCAHTLVTTNLVEESTSQPLKAQALLGCCAPGHAMAATGDDRPSLEKQLVGLSQQVDFVLPSALVSAKRKRTRGGSPESQESQKTTSVWRHRAIDSNTGKRGVVCRFMCGCNSDSQDPVDLDALIRWGKQLTDRLPDGSV